MCREEGKNEALKGKKQAGFSVGDLFFITKRCLIIKSMYSTLPSRFLVDVLHESCKLVKDSFSVWKFVSFGGFCRNKATLK